jgi:hypothetical protein
MPCSEILDNPLLVTIEAGDWSRFTSLTALFVFMSG